MVVEWACLAREHERGKEVPTGRAPMAHSDPQIIVVTAGDCLSLAREAAATSQGDGTPWYHWRTWCHHFLPSCDSQRVGSCEAPCPAVPPAAEPAFLLFLRRLGESLAGFLREYRTNSRPSTSSKRNSFKGVSLASSSSPSLLTSRGRLARGT